MGDGWVEIIQMVEDEKRWMGERLGWEAVIK